jgi:polyphosphate kinase 2 (PPK2 family)
LKALGDMVEMTDRPNAHWDLIAAEDKRYARVAVLETLIDRWEHDLERRGFVVPVPREGDYLK